MSIPAIEGISGVSGFTPLQPIDVATNTPRTVQAPPGPAGPAFGDLVTQGLDRLSSVQGAADSLATQAATGDLQALHQYTIAATEAQVTTQLTVAVRNKALEAFNEIMRMPIG